MPRTIANVVQDLRSNADDLDRYATVPGLSPAVRVDIVAASRSVRLAADRVANRTVAYPAPPLPRRRARTGA